MVVNVLILSFPIFYALALCLSAFACRSMSTERQREMAASKVLKYERKIGSKI